MQFDQAKVAEQIEEAQQEERRGAFDRILITYTRLHERARKGHYGFRNDPTRAHVAGDEIRNRDGSITTVIQTW